jgi:hypothetical protein
MKKTVLAGLALALLPTTAALAGWKEVWPVQIHDNNANGSLGSTRNSADEVSLLGCDLTGYPGGDHVGHCYAQNEKRTVSCYFVNEPGFASAISSMSDGSWLWFFWDDLGRCTVIDVRNNSMWEPRQP